MYVEFELNSGQKVLCIDQCREGRIEMEKIRAIHEQITSNLQVRVTIEELSKQYDMPATSMKNVFVKFMEIPFILTRRDNV